LIILHSIFNEDDISRFKMKLPTTIPLVIEAALFRDPAAEAEDPLKGIYGGKTFLNI
jgi:hypothetical protein